MNDHDDTAAEIGPDDISADPTLPYLTLPHVPCAAGTSWQPAYLRKAARVMRQAGASAETRDVRHGEVPRG